MARDARAVAELLGRFEAEHLRPLVERAQVEGGRGGPKGRSRNVNGTAMEGVTAEDGAAGPSSPPQAGSDSGGDRDEAGKSLGDDGGPDGGLPDAIQRVRAPGGDAGTGRMISLEAEQPADWVYRYVTSDGEGGAPSSSMAEASSDGRTEGVTAASQQHQHNSTSAGGEGGVDLEMTDHGHHAGTGAGQGGVEVIELE